MQHLPTHPPTTPPLLSAAPLPLQPPQRRRLSQLSEAPLQPLLPLALPLGLPLPLPLHVPLPLPLPLAFPRLLPTSSPLLTELLVVQMLAGVVWLLPLLLVKAVAAPPLSRPPQPSLPAMASVLEALLSPMAPLLLVALAVPPVLLRPRLQRSRHWLQTWCGW